MSKAKEVGAAVATGAAAGAGAVVGYQAWKRLAERDMVDGRPAELRRLDPTKISADPDTFQFKSGGDSHGVTDRLRSVSKWNPVAAGKTMVFEKLDGSHVIADGHQRLGLAQRLSSEGQKGIKLDAYVLRERDGWTVRDVRAYAAIKNMHESSGQALDMAKVMRERPDLVTKSMPLSDQKIRDAKNLAKLSDAAFKAVVGGVVKPEYAAAVGEAIGDSTRHEGLIKEMAKAGVSSTQHARLYVGQAMAASTITEHTSSLFGEESNTRSLLKERAAVLDKALSALKSDKRIFGLLEREAGNIEAVGNKLSHAANVEKAEGAGRTAALIEKLGTTRGPVSDMIDHAARAVAEGKKPAAAAREFVKHVGDSLKKGGINALTGDGVLAGNKGWQPEAMEKWGKILDDLPAGHKQVAKRRDGMEKAAGKANPIRVQRMEDGPIKLGNGDRVRSESGRELSPFPNVDASSNGKAGNTIKRVDAWLVAEAIAEAKATRNDYVHDLMSRMNPAKMTVADRDMANQFLFGTEEGVKAKHVVAVSPRNEPSSQRTGQSSMFGEATTADKIAAANRAQEAKGRTGDPMNDGLFGSSSKQTDLVDMAKRPSRYADAITEHREAISSGNQARIAAAKEALDKHHNGGWSDAAREASAEARKAEPRGMDGLTRSERSGKAKPLPVIAGNAPEGAPMMERFRSAYEATLTEQVKANPGKYGYGVDRVPEMARKMTEALAKGNGDTQSPTVKAVTKALGIKPTVGGIKAALNDQPPPSPKPAEPGLSARQMGDAQRAIKSGGPMLKTVDLSKATNAQLQKLDDAALAARRAQTGNGNADWSKISQIENWRDSIRAEARKQTGSVVNNRPTNPNYTPGVGTTQESYWSHKAPPTPTVNELPPGAFSGTQREFESLSPGMRREIKRAADLEAIKRKTREALGPNGDGKHRRTDGTPILPKGNVDMYGVYMETPDVKARIEHLKQGLGEIPAGAIRDATEKQIKMLSDELGKRNPGWSDEARAASAEVRGEKAMAKAPSAARESARAEFVKTFEREPAKSMSIKAMQAKVASHWKNVATVGGQNNMAWRASGIVPEHRTAEQAKANVMASRGTPSVSDAERAGRINRLKNRAGAGGLSGEAADKFVKENLAKLEALDAKRAQPATDIPIVASAEKFKGTPIPPKPTSGKRGTQNKANQEAIIKNRKANAKPKREVSIMGRNPYGSAPGALTQSQKDAMVVKGGPAPDFKAPDPMKLGQARLDTAKAQAAIAKSTGSKKFAAAGLHNVAEADKRWNQAETATGQKTGANSAEKPTTTGKTTGRNTGKKALGLLAPVAIGATALIAANQSAKAGESKTEQAKAAGTEAAKGAGVMAGFVAGTAVIAKGFMKAGLTAAKAAPATQAVLMAAGAAHGAVTAKPGERLKGAAIGAWDMSLPGMVVNTGKAVVEAARSTADRAPVNGRISEQQARAYAGASQRFATMRAAAQETDGPSKSKGWSNAARIGAYQARAEKQGFEPSNVPYGGKPENGPDKWAGKKS